jgi:hypothetical protein
MPVKNQQVPTLGGDFFYLIMGWLGIIDLTPSAYSPTAMTPL